MKKILIGISTLVLVLTSTFVVPPKPVHALQQLVYPVVGPSRYSNDFYAPRSSGTHNATDIIANKMQALVAATDGTIVSVNYPMPSWGWSVTIKDAAGYLYTYIHMNDDTPGTDDGMGGPMLAYAPDIKVGNPVVAGQLLGWVGDSGRANKIPHLHFEIETPDGVTVNPFGHLNDARRIPWPVIPPQMPNEILPYGTNFTGGLSMAMGNIDGDPASELVTGAGRGGSPHVRYFDNNKAPLGGGFYAYDPAFTGGIDVALGDVDGDGTDDIITAAGPGGGPHVRIIRTDGTEIGSFYAYASTFPGGVHVAAADVDGDGNAEIITAPASMGGPHVRVMEANGTQVSGFYAYASNFYGGIDVAAADVSGGSTAEIITSPGPGGSPHIRMFNGSGTPQGDFAAYGEFNGGVKISAGNVRTNTSKAEILVAPWTTGGPHIRMFNGSGTVLAEKMFMEPWWGGYHDVVAGNGVSFAGTSTNRRASIRDGF